VVLMQFQGPVAVYAGGNITCRHADGAVISDCASRPGAGGGALEMVKVGKGHPAGHYEIGICGYINCALNRL
jgi:hypothetical protein